MGTEGLTYSTQLAREDKKASLNKRHRDREFNDAGGGKDQRTFISIAEVRNGKSSDPAPTWRDHRVYDDEDAELQAALRASLETATGPITSGCCTAAVLAAAIARISRTAGDTTTAIVRV